MTTRRFAWLRRLWSLSTGRFGLIVVLLIGLTALVARFWTPFDPQRVDVANRWDAPGIPHLLGTDDLGRDVLSRLLHGARVSVLVGLAAAAHPRRQASGYAAVMLIPAAMALSWLLGSLLGVTGQSLGTGVSAAWTWLTTAALVWVVAGWPEVHHHRGCGGGSE